MGNPTLNQGKSGIPMQARPIPMQSKPPTQAKPAAKPAGVPSGSAVKPVVKPVQVQAAQANSNAAASPAVKPVVKPTAQQPVSPAQTQSVNSGVKPAAPVSPVSNVKPAQVQSVSQTSPASAQQTPAVTPVDKKAVDDAKKQEMENRKKDQAQLNAARQVAKKTHTASADDITIGLLNDDAFGDLLPYIKDVNVTDINWNGRQLWIDDLKKGRYNANVNLTQAFINQFSTRVSNVVSENFNKYHPKLEAETEELRISILHDSVAHTGTSISMRKTPAVRRINFNAQIKNGDYCSEEMANFMSNAVKAGMNIIICGLPGDGKTELLKFLTSYIPPKDRVITVEDNLEIHYHNINPDKDCIELKVDESFTYVDAIKACLRQLPRWIMLSEARSIEVKYLIEALSTGAHCMTTIHTDDVRKLPNRIKNMVGDNASAERIEQDVYNFLDMGILIKKRYDEKGNIFRYLSQMGVFDEDKQEIVLIFDEGKRTDAELPSSILRKFMIAGIENPFAYTKVQW